MQGKTEAEFAKLAKKKERMEKKKQRELNPPEPKKRGRPPKNRTAGEETASASTGPAKPCAGAHAGGAAGPAVESASTGPAKPRAGAHPGGAAGPAVECTPKRKCTKRVKPVTPLEGGTPPEKLQPERKKEKGENAGKSRKPPKALVQPPPGEEPGAGPSASSDKRKGGNDAHSKRVARASLALQKLQNLPSVERNEMSLPGPTFDKLSFTVASTMQFSLCKIGVVLYSETFYVYGTKKRPVVIPDILTGVIEANPGKSN